jgi:peptidoglycan/xylan/chitin deacetylase (PgdA/CDA1 family)
MLKSLIKKSNQQLILPFYHLVSNKNPNYIKHLYTPKNSNQFKADLDTFLKYYQPISLKELIAINKQEKKISKPSFHLTFDDGLSNFYDIVAPILIEKKIPATVFLNTAFVDNQDLFYRYKVSLLIENYLTTTENQKKKYYNFISEKDLKRKNKVEIDGSVISFLLGINFQNMDLLDDLANQLNYSFDDFLKTKKPYLTLKQIKELQKQGFTFGAHSKNHPLYANLNLEQQINQTEESLKWIQNNLNIDYKTFSFPFSDHGVSEKFFNKIDLDLSFGISKFKKDEILTNIHRIDMEKSTINTKQLLIKEYLKYFVNTSLGRNKIKRN